jgi:serine/threonine protein kinase
MGWIIVIHGLLLVHRKLIMHRDIKPQNIVVDSDRNVKIIDFGTAAKLKHKDEKLQGSIGTYCFMAPEVLGER